MPEVEVESRRAGRAESSPSWSWRAATSRTAAGATQRAGDDAPRSARPARARGARQPRHPVPCRRADRPVGAVRARLGDDRAPCCRSPPRVVCGLNSARPWRHQGGRLERRRPARARTPVRRRGPPGALRVVVLHHHLAGAPWRASRKNPLKHRDDVLPRSGRRSGARPRRPHPPGHGRRAARFEALGGRAARGVVLASAPGIRPARPHRLGEANGLHVSSDDTTSRSRRGSGAATASSPQLSSGRPVPNGCY